MKAPAVYPVSRELRILDTPEPALKSPTDSEWLESDGLGGFASGTVSGIRTRRYHGLLVAAIAPPTGRRVLLSGVDAWIEADGTMQALTSQAYMPDVTHPDGVQRLVSFRRDPWPRWQYELRGGARIAYELFMVHGLPLVVLRWGYATGARPERGRLFVRPFLAFRDYHGLCHRRDDFALRPDDTGNALVFWPHPEESRLYLQTNGRYHHEPHWYRQFRYDEERNRGFDCQEDLASPGVISFDLEHTDAVAVFTTSASALGSQSAVLQQADGFRSAEFRRRASFSTPLHRAADTYLVKRGTGKTIMAGYPWFTDWGRDTFIAVRGLCTAIGNYDAACDVLLQWADSVSEGMLPNRFPDSGGVPEYNAVDASLWYVVAVHELLDRAAQSGCPISPRNQRQLREAVAAILQGYCVGTRYGIHLDRDGLLAAGEPGVQLTWMDARVGDRVITPRIGKPVEVQALWWNALSGAAEHAPEWRPLAERALRSFTDRFWNADRAMLYDVVDVDHREGTVDESLRPNQIFAIGGLPRRMLKGRRARSVVDTIETHLWTPLGLRTLDPRDSRYVSLYQGGPAERDAAYHQGTAWPWLIGPFVEAWLRVRRNTKATRKQAHDRFVAPLLLHLGCAGLGHVSEIVDPESPHRPKGCPFQAWSTGELLRLIEQVQ